MSLRLTEYPNASVVEMICRHKWIYDEQKDMMHAYLKSIKDGKAQILYKGRKQNDTVLGRLYSSTPYMLSSCNMWSRSRATLFKDTEMDIDMVNAHFNLLLAMCKRYREHFSEDKIEMLQKYCNNRQDMFDDIYINELIIDEYNDLNNETKTKKDFLKTLFTIKLYGGSIKTWEKTFGLNSDDYELSDDFRALEFELVYIAKTIVKIHPKADVARAMYMEKVKKKIKQKLYHDDSDGGDKRLKEPHNNKLLAYLLQDKEREVVVDAITKAKKYGLTVTCYSYDGFQIKKDERIHSFLKTINDLDEGVEFIVKPFRDPLPLDNKYLNDPEPESFNPLTMWRIGLKQHYDEDTQKYILQPTRHNDMIKKKEYFEQYFMFIDNQKKICQEMSSGSFNFINPTDGKYFANVLYINERGDKAQFLNWWLTQMDRRQFEKLECLPPPCTVPKNVYNLWKGFGIAEEELDPSADISLIMDHFYNIAGRDDIVRDYLLDWYAHKVQKPAIKTEVCLILYTPKQGAGKGLFAEEIMNALLGKYQTEYFAVLDSIKDIGERFNNIGEKLLAVVNEVEGRDSYGLIEKIKDFITRKTFNREIKGATMERGLRALCDMIMTTNNDTCMKIDQSDRRFVVIECNEDMIGDINYFKKLWEAIADKTIMRSFYEFLMKRDISNFMPQMCRPKTAIYEDMQKASLSPIQLFWAEQYIKWEDAELDPVDKPVLKDKFNAFNCFYENSYPNKSHNYSKEAFSRASRKLPGFCKDCQTIRIDGKTAKAFVINYPELNELYQKTL